MAKHRLKNAEDGIGRLKKLKEKLGEATKTPLSLDKLYLILSELLSIRSNFQSLGNVDPKTGFASVKPVELTEDQLRRAKRNYIRWTLTYGLSVKFTSRDGHVGYQSFGDCPDIHGLIARIEELGHFPSPEEWAQKDPPSLPTPAPLTEAQIAALDFERPPASSQENGDTPENEAERLRVLAEIEAIFQELGPTVQIQHTTYGGYVNHLSQGTQQLEEIRLLP